MSYRAICLMAKCLTCGMIYKRKEMKKAGTLQQALYCQRVDDAVIRLQRSIFDHANVIGGIPAFVVVVAPGSTDCVEGFSQEEVQAGGGGEAAPATKQRKEGRDLRKWITATG